MPKAKEESLDIIWAKKLKASGFEDCENINLPDRPLKEWHGSKYSSEKTIQKIEVRNEYQKLIDSFTNHKEFEEICRPKFKRKLDLKDIKDLWNLSTQEGWTERKLAEKFKVSKTSIHYALERLRKWMAIL